MDSKDRMILELLQDDAEIPLSDIAARVNLSSTPCWRRIQKLRDSGVIRKNVAVCEPVLLNVCVTVFVAIRATQQSQVWLDRCTKCL